MEQPELHSDFREFLSLLNSNEVRYLVVGGYAVACHGYPRATKDLDIWIDAAPRNVRRRMTADFGGVCTFVVGLADLRRNKEAAGRHRDLDDLENLPVPD